MKICQHCNSQMEDYASFCPYCGQRSDSAPAGTGDAYEKAFHAFRRNLRHERKCWNIFGGVWIGFCAFFAGFSLLYVVLGIALEEPVIMAFAPVFLTYVAVFLPLAIINLVMGKKITGYLDRLETDPAPAVDRCGGVWLIVMGALFNTIAMIFIILNFVHVKTHSAILLQK